MAQRSKAREVALQMLYQQDLNSDIPAETVHELIREHLQNEPLTRFAWELFQGVMEVRGRLDLRIQAVASNWSLTRMAPTDRNVLRLGAWELLFSDTPHRVVIDEAIELARKFGAAQSPQFVNGILDKLIPEAKRGNRPPVPLVEPPAGAEGPPQGGLPPDAIVESVSGDPPSGPDADE